MIAAQIHGVLISSTTTWKPASTNMHKNMTIKQIKIGVIDWTINQNFKSDLLLFLRSKYISAIAINKIIAGSTILEIISIKFNVHLDIYIGNFQ